MNPTELKLLIFDWDGTLMDSVGQIVAAMQGAIVDLDLPRREDHEIADVIGLGLEDAMEKLFPEYRGEDVSALVRSYRTHFKGKRVPSSRLFPSVTEELDRLRAAGFRLAVATGKSRAGLDSSFKSTGIADRFELSRCADETASKPNPKMLHEILDQTGLEPEHAVMIGDTEYDVEMAVAIGMPAVGVDCGVHSADRLRNAGAHTVLPEVPGLHDYLEGL